MGFGCTVTRSLSCKSEIHKALKTESVISPTPKSIWWQNLPRTGVAACRLPFKVNIHVVYTRSIILLDSRVLPQAWLGKVCNSHILVCNMYTALPYYNP